MAWATLPKREPKPQAPCGFSVRGHKSRDTGMFFEDLIEKSCEVYRQKGAAYIEKTPEPTRMLRAPDKTGRFPACYTKRGQPDYKGTLAGGRSVVFEAKHTDKDRILQNRLTPEQTQSLELHHSLGSEAFVLVSFEFRSFFHIPWPVWRDMKERFGRLYVKPEELEEYRVLYRGGVIWFLD